MTDTTVREELWEQEMIDSGVERYRRAVMRAQQRSKEHNHLPGTESSTTYGVTLLREYVESIAKQISHDTVRMQGRPGRKPIAWEYLSHLDHEMCAFVTAKVVLDNISGVVMLSTLVNRIAGKIEDQTRIDLFRGQHKKYYQATQTYQKTHHKSAGYRRKRKIFVNAARRREDIIKEWEPWPLNDRIHLGNALLEAFIKVTSDYDSDGKRIYGSGIVEKYLQRDFGKTKYLVTGTTKAAEWIRVNQSICQFFYPDFMPTLIPPKDWSTPTDGGYHLEELRKRKPLVKMQQKKYLRSMAQRGYSKMKKFYDTVNTLQSTPWEVNTFVYTQALKEFNRVEGVGMPRTEPKPEPPPPYFFVERGSMSQVEFKMAKQRAVLLWTPEQKSEYQEWTNAMNKYKEQETERVSNLMQITRTMNMARKLAFEDEFYFVWTADFRQRLYVVGTALSIQGTDLQKGLCKFHRGVPLGADGMWHLCVHAAGVYGVDKVSLADRYAWVMNHKEEIIKTYEDSDSMRDFWGAADKPYLFLAVCEELGQCLQLSTNEQQYFVSHIPCNQDGSCNGIQHYSAMLRDPIGAHAVNLIDSEVPADIYQQCADKVKEYIYHCRAANVRFTGKEWVPSEGFHTEIAEGWEDFGITRDCTKKPTMVIPYGGTKISCRDDCNNYLKDATKKKRIQLSTYQNPFVDLMTYNEKGKKTDPEVEAITWLHHLVWLSLDDVVVSARVAMAFLQGIIKAISKISKDGRPVQWTTKTGFIVYQEIKSVREVQIKTHLEGELKLKLQHEIDKLDKRRMRTSIAPNFVHSVDATHLCFTVDEAREAYGIRDFAMVHDSYGTHAGNCTNLHKCIRSEFYALHQDHLLVDFWLEQVNRYPEAIGDMPDVDDVKQGEFDLKHVLNATHFFR